MNTDTAVLDLVDAWAAAEAHNDAESLEQLLTADFRGVGPVGFVLDRDFWLGRFDKGLSNSAFAVVEPQIRVHGDAAVVIGILEQTTDVKGEDNSGRFRISLLAVREGDRWLLANVHLGPLTFPGPPAA